MPTCSSCEAEVTANSTYCRKCGHKLSESAIDESPAAVGDDGAAGTTTASATRTVTKEVSVSASSLEPQVLKAHLQEMDEYEFEHLVADLWGEMGWDTTVSQASVDAGLDVVAEKHTPYHQKKVIQAKRYGDSTTVGGPDIQQYASLKQQVNDADSVVIVTTSSFTSSAESRATDLNVKLVDGDDLVGMIHDLNAYGVVDDYLNISKTVTEEVAVESDSNPGFEPEPSSTEGAEPSNPAVDVDQEQEERAPGSSTTESVTASTLMVESAPFGITYWHWISVVTGVLTYATLNVSETLFGVFLLATAVAVYLDIRFVRSQASWDPRKWFYIGGLFVALLSLPIYLVNRYRHMSG